MVGPVKTQTIKLKEQGYGMTDQFHFFEAYTSDRARAEHFHAGQRTETAVLARIGNTPGFF